MANLLATLPQGLGRRADATPDDLAALYTGLPPSCRPHIYDAIEALHAAREKSSGQFISSGRWQPPEVWLDAPATCFLAQHGMLTLTIGPLGKGFVLTFSRQAGRGSLPAQYHLMHEDGRVVVVPTLLLAGEIALTHSMDGTGAEAGVRDKCHWSVLNPWAYLPVVEPVTSGSKRGRA
jgi:hypothetical protein